MRLEVLRRTPGRRRIIAAFFVLVLLALALWRHARREDPRREHTFIAMGGIPITVSVWDRSEEAFAGDLAAAIALVERLESVLSDYRPESEISRINRAAAGEAIAIGEDAARILALAFRIARETGGAFDAASGALFRLWKGAERLPAEEDLRRIRAACGLAHFRFDPAGRTVVKDAAAAALDLGGIAKGYMADRVVEMLRDRGVRRALVAVGGDIEGIGGAPPFTIGIRDPRGGPRDVIGTVALARGAISTSGAYERFVEIDGVRYGHIVDPRTGRPVAGPLSVSIRSAEGAVADALATAVFVLGREEGLRAVRSLGAEALIIEGEAGPDGGLRFHATEGFHMERPDGTR
ncbi:MAG: FAD:protein FMN transferase [Planctomycetes bacterium]|nr:FAD:protein FMN transferase [Planctomycetota bacterium]